MKIEVKGANARVTERTLLTSGAVGLTCEFTFDRVWDGLMKTAVFRSGSVTRDVVNIETTVTVPHEVLAQGGQKLFVGVYGVNGSGDLAIPTVWVDMGLILHGADPSGDPGTDPTLPVWAQVMTDTVQTVSQALTEEQQKQARENIGAARGDDGSVFVGRDDEEVEISAEAPDIQENGYITANRISLYGMAFDSPVILSHLADGREDSDAATVRQVRNAGLMAMGNMLNDPTKQLTPEFLSFYYGADFYESFDTALADVSSGTIGVNGSKDATDSKCAVYTDSDGNLNMVLLADLVVEKQIDIQNDITWRLNGFTVSFADDFKIKINTENSTIDGRVPGSKIVKDVPQKQRDEVQALIHCLTEQTGKNICTLIGCEIECITTPTYKTQNVIAAQHIDKMKIVDCNIKLSAHGTSSSVLCVNCLDCNVADITGTSINVTADSNHTGRARAIQISGSCNIDGLQLYMECQTSSTYCIMFFPSDTSEMTIKNTKIVALGGRNGGNCIATATNYGRGKLYIDDVDIYTRPYYQIESLPCVDSYAYTEISNSVLEADGTAGYYPNNGTHVGSDGCFNYGSVYIIKGTTIKGTHSGYQTNGVSIISDSHFSGQGHGGMYMGGQQGDVVYGENSLFETVNYAGQLKDQYLYDGQYMVAGAYIGSGSNLSAYFDNCVFDGHGPKATDYTGHDAEPIRFRSSGGEENNKVYISNTTMQGAGKIGLHCPTGMLYVCGQGNNLLCEPNISEHMDTTTYPYYSNVLRDPIAIFKKKYSTILSELSDETGGTLSLRKMSVNFIYQTADRALDGSTSAEWLALVATKPNWTIVLT